MIRLRSVLAVLFSLLLLGAQQAAFAHLIGHIGPVERATSDNWQGDDGHGQALALADLCPACVSAAGLAAGAAPGVPPRLTFDRAHEVPGTARCHAKPLPAAQPYLARAPPTAL